MRTEVMLKQQPDLHNIAQTHHLRHTQHNYFSPNNHNRFLRFSDSQIKNNAATTNTPIKLFFDSKLSTPTSSPPVALNLSNSAKSSRSVSLPLKVIQINTNNSQITSKTSNTDCTKEIKSWSESSFSESSLNHTSNLNSCGGRFLYSPLSLSEHNISSLLWLNGASGGSGISLNHSSNMSSRNLSPVSTEIASSNSINKQFEMEENNSSSSNAVESLQEANLLTIDLNNNIEVAGIDVIDLNATPTYVATTAAEYEEEANVESASSMSSNVDNDVFYLETSVENDKSNSNKNNTTLTTSNLMPVVENIVERVETKSSVNENEAVVNMHKPDTNSSLTSNGSTLSVESGGCDSTLTACQHAANQSEDNTDVQVADTDTDAQLSVEEKSTPPAVSDFSSR